MPTPHYIVTASRYAATDVRPWLVRDTDDDRVVASFATRLHAGDFADLLNRGAEESARVLRRLDSIDAREIADHDGEAEAIYREQFIGGAS